MLLVALVDQGRYSSQVLALGQQLHAAVQQHAAELCSLLDHCCRLQMHLGTTAASLVPDRTLFSPALLLPGPGHAMLLRAAAAAAGPGSAEQQRLWSVLASMVKYCGCSGKASSKDACTSRCAVQHAVDVLLLGRWHTYLPGGNVDSFSSSSSSSPGTSSSPAAATGHTAQALAAWLALGGRCLLLLSAELMQQLAVTPELMREAISMGHQAQQMLAAKAGLERAPGTTGCVRSDDMRLLATLLGILQDSSMSAQLSAAGYDVQTPLGSLELAPVLASTPAPAETAGQHSVSSSICIGLQHSLLIRHLQVAGACLNDMPFSWGCNNPACSNMTGPSELQLVKGKVHSCKGCRTARYCGRACQVAHWKQHKRACKALDVARCAANSVTG
jgi:hypothetical protein